MNRYRDRRNKNKGFTLAELLIVVAITIILAAVGFIAIFQYQQNLKFTEMENDAREVFLAAQNSLTSMKENGVTLTEHGNKMTDKIGNDASDAPSDLSDALKKAGIKEDAGDYWSKNSSHFRYVSHKAGEEITEGSLLDQILDFGSIDETIRRDGSYIIEYDEDTYTVYGVFYSDSNQIRKENVDLSDNKYYSYLTKYREDKFKEDRKKFGEKNNLGRLTTAGYYGAATDDKEDADSKNLKQPEILIYNSGKITFKDHANQNGTKSKAVKNKTVKADEADYSSSSQLKNFNTSSEQLQNELKDTLSLAVVKPENNVYKVVVRVSGRTSGNHQDFTYLNGGTNRDWGSEGGYIYLKLDDITKSQKNFAHVFNKMIPGEDISASVHFETKKGTNSRSETLPANSLFDNVQTSKDKDNKEVKTALIRSPRQLQNLEPDVSVINKDFDTNKKKNGIQDYTKISQVLVEENIDWNWNGGKETNNQKTIIYKDDKGKVGDGTDKQFLSINNSEIKSFDGNNSTISNLNAVKNSDGHAGLFSKTSGKLTIQNLTLESPTVVSKSYTTNDEANNAGSLIGSVKSGDSELLIENVVIKDPVVTSSNKNAGGLIGKIDDGHVTLTNIEINADKKNINITGEEDAGGLIGSVEGGTLDIKSISLDTDSENILINGNDEAGGIVGFLKPYANSKFDSVSYDGGEKGLVKADQHSVGGFAGRVESNGLTITNSYASTYLYTAGNYTDNEPSRAGGFVGYISQSSGNTVINDCFYGGRIKDSDERNGSKSGYGVDQTKITDDYSKIVKGNFNIVNNGESKDVNNGTSRRNASAGGFIGSANGDAGTIQISNSFTTGSVFTNYGPVGGFVGQSSISNVAEQSPLVLKNTYATGAVDSKNSDSDKGNFVGRHPLNTSSSDNHYLNGINSGLTVIGDNKNNPSGTIISGINSGAVPFAQTQNVNNKTKKRYADDLQDQTYPFAFVSDLDSSATLNEYVGDWPIVEPTKSNYAFDNGNKLTFHIALPADTNDFTMAVQGLADIGSSQRIVYAPFHIVRDSSGKITSVQWVNFFQSQWFDWSNGWYQYGQISNCQIAHVESADSFKAAYLRSNGSDYTSNENQIYFAVDLDDLSKNQIYEAGPFASLFSRLNEPNRLYPGEDICVRIKTGIEKFDISSDPGITANSIYANGSNGTSKGNDANTALIANSRHLENLSRRLSGVSDFNVDQIKYTKAKQVMDIIWSDDDNSTNDYISDIKTRNNEPTVNTIWWDNSDNHSSNNSFYPINNSSLQEYDGNNKVIKNLTIDTNNVPSITGHEPASIFEMIADSGSIKNLIIDSEKASTKAGQGNVNAAGLIGSGNSLKLNNIRIQGDSVITANNDSGSAGGIAGNLSGNSTLSDCAISGDNVQISSVHNAAGGLIGFSDGSAMIENSQIHGNIIISSGSGNGLHGSGGLVGLVKSGSLTINNSIVEGSNAKITTTPDGNTNQLSAGGLVGVTGGGTKLSIKNSAASAYVVGQQDAGGLVGLSNGTVDIQSSYSGGHTYQTQYQDTVDEGSAGRYNVVARNGYAGGLIGNNKGQLSYNKVFSAASVKAQNNVAGGIFGHSITTNVKDDDISYVIGLVSGNTADNTGAYTGKADNNFYLGDAYYLPELYQKRNIDVKTVADKSKASGSVADAYFDVDNTEDQEKQGRHGVAAKKTGDFADITSVYDSQLKGSEYPFKVWTKFNFNDLNGTAYVGDWEPANLKTSSAVKAVFEYQNPETGTLTKIGGSFGTQQITVGKNTTLTLPLAPSFSAADNTSVSYEPDGWYQVNDDNTVSDKEMANASASTVAVKQKQPKDLVIAVKYKASQNTKYGVTFNIADPDNPSGVKTVKKIVNANDSVSAPVKDFNGYSFDGWYENGNKVDDSFFKNVSRSITVDAKYQKIEKFTVTIQFMRKADNNITEQLSQQPYVLTGIKGQDLDQDVTLPSTISNLTPEPDTAQVVSGSAEITGPTLDSNRTRIHIKASDSAIIHVFYTGTISTNGKYTIEHIFEDTSADSNYEQNNLKYESGSEYTYSVAAEQDQGLATGANALDVTGFEAEPFTQEIVKSEKAGETVVKIHYKRRSHHVIYRSNGGSYIAPATFAYGQQITNPADVPTRDGYDFNGWTYTYRYTKDANGNNVAVNAGSAMPDEDVIATAGWKGTQVNYTVMYWLENANDNNYSPDLDSIITKKGITGDQVELTAEETDVNKFEGFHYDPKNQLNINRENNKPVIKGDGSTVVNVYYNRNTYDVIFYTDYDKYNLKPAYTGVREVGPNDSWSYYKISQNVTIPQHDIAVTTIFNDGYTQANSGDYIKDDDDYYYVGNGKGNYKINSWATRRVSAQTFDSSEQYTRSNSSLLYYLQYNPGAAQVRYYNASSQTNVLRGTGEIKELRIHAKYGADISAEWPGNRTDIDNNYRHSKWFTVTDYNPPGQYRDNNGRPYYQNYYSAITSQSGLTLMPLNGAEFIYQEEKGDNIFQSVFYGENVNDSGYRIIHTDSFRSNSNRTDWTTTKEDHYDLTGFTFNSSDQRNSAEGSAPNPVKNNPTTYQWSFYYTRNTYNITFNDGGNPVYSDEVKYQADISQKEAEAEKKLESPGEGYTFDGWYQNDQLLGEKYDFNGKLMPAGDLVFYAKWIPPVHSVTFDPKAPTGLSATAPAVLTDVEDGTSIEDQMISEGNLSDAYTPKLLNSDGTPNTEYNFTGWYTDQACNEPFVYASEVHSDMTLYAGWEHVAGKRNISVNYVYRYVENGQTIVQNLAQEDTVEGDIGQPLTINAKMDIGGYYPQQTQHSVIVESEDANPDQSVTFYYNKVQFNWQYQVKYYVRYNNGQNKILVATSKKYDPTYYQMQIVYGSDEAPVPDKLKNYHVVGENIKTINGEHADQNDHLVMVEFDLEVDTSTTDLESKDFTYDGEGDGLRLDQNFDTIDTSDNGRISYSLETEYGYRRNDGTYEYKSEKPIDAGIYPVRGTLIEKVSNGSSQNTETIWKSDENSPVYMTINRRKITLLSESLTDKPSGKTLYSKADTNDELDKAVTMKDGTWIITDENGHKTGESNKTSYGIDEVQFAANAYRLDNGQAVNAFDYEIDKSHIKETNYDIYKEYGTLTIE